MYIAMYRDLTVWESNVPVLYNFKLTQREMDYLKLEFKKFYDILFSDEKTTKDCIS